jgi:hypothetical protein
MRLILAAVVLLLIAAVLAYLLLESRRRRRGARWTVSERSDGEAVLVEATRPGERPLLVERVPLADPGFELRVEEARASARSKVVALNDGRR